MAEYIEREAAIEAVCENCNKIFPEEPCEPSDCTIMQMLRSIPTADVRPVVRGKWTRIDYEPHGHDYKCSACGWKNDMQTHFCPNCGADMREES